MTNLEVSHVVGGDHSYFPDDIESTCVRCKLRVYVRPHAPKPLVGYLCIGCAASDLRMRSDIQVFTTKTAINEAVEYFKKKRDEA
jgi:hypothetical protein